MGAPAAIAARRRKIVSHFLSQNAVSPENAVTYEPKRRIDRRLFERLRGKGVIKQDNRGGFYIDVPSLDAETRARRKFAGGVIATLAVVVGAAIAFG